MLVFDCEGEEEGGTGKKKRTCKMSEETRVVEKSVLDLTWNNKIASNESINFNCKRKKKQLNIRKKGKLIIQRQIEQNIKKALVMDGKSEKGRRNHGEKLATLRPEKIYGGPTSPNPCTLALLRCTF